MPFLRQHTESFAKLWGGFPDRTVTPEAFQHMFLVDAGDGKTRLVDLLVLDHMVGWWKYRNEPNVLVVHYSDRIKDPSANVDRIAGFLGIALSPEEKRAVIENSSFKWMKNNPDVFSACGTFEYLRRERGIETGTECLLEKKAMVSKGSERDGEGELSREFRERLEAHFVKTLGRPVFEWMKTGGVDKMPNVEVP